MHSHNWHLTSCSVANCAEIHVSDARTNKTPSRSACVGYWPSHPVTSWQLGDCGSSRSTSSSQPDFNELEHWFFINEIHFFITQESPGRHKQLCKQMWFVVLQLETLRKRLLFIIGPKLQRIHPADTTKFKFKERKTSPQTIHKLIP